MISEQQPQQPQRQRATHANNQGENEKQSEIQDARMAQEAGMRHEAKTETQSEGAEE